MDKIKLLEDIVISEYKKSLKKYSYLISDIDDTILDSDGKFPEVVKNELISIKDKLCLATGRDYTFAKKYAEEIGCKYIITSNGGLCTELKTGDIIYIDKFPDKDVELMINVVKKYECLITIETPKEVFNEVFNMNTEDKETIEFIKLTETYRRFNTIHLKDNIYNYIKENNIPVLVFRVSCKNYNSELVNELLDINSSNFYNKIKDLENHPLKENQEIFNINISPDTKIAKINAVRALMKKLNIDIEDVVAVGNGGNDIDLIKGVGLGFAVKNSCDKLLRSADKIASKTNDEFAICDIINTYFK